MAGKTRKYRRRNEGIRDNLGVARSEDKMKEKCLGGVAAYIYETRTSCNKKK